MHTSLGIVTPGIRRGREEGGKAGQRGEPTQRCKVALWSWWLVTWSYRTNWEVFLNVPQDFYTHLGWRRKEEACNYQLLSHTGQRLTPGGDFLSFFFFFLIELLFWGCFIFYTDPTFFCCFFGHTIQHVGTQFPHQGSKLCPLQCKHRVPTTGPPRKSPRGDLVSMVMHAWPWALRDVSHTLSSIEQPYNGRQSEGGATRLLLG